MESVENKVKYILEEDLGFTIKSFDDELDIDSLEWVELIMWLEEDLKISIPDEDVKNLKTASSIIKYVKRR